MLYIIPPLSCPELCRRSKARLGGYCDTPNFSLLTPNSLHPPLPPPFQEGAQFDAELSLSKYKYSEKLRTRMKMKTNGNISCIKQSGEGYDAPPTLV